VEVVGHNITDDLRITWRLRNLKPNQQSVRSCGEAWLSGKQRPPLETSSFSHGGSRFAGTPRLALFRRRIAHPKSCNDTIPGAGTTGEATDADIHYAEGNWATAANLYAAAVAASRDQVETWSGLRGIGNCHWVLFERRPGTLPWRLNMNE